MTHRRHLDALYPDDWLSMPIAWDALHIPAPPTAFALSDAERDNDSPGGRYHRRTIQALSVTTHASPGRDPQTDTLAFIDKAIPHSQFDLMATDISPRMQATLTAIGERSLATLLHSAERFIAFVSRPETRDRYRLDDGLAHIALNCDPNTRDRESCQAVKSFHLHFIYWTAAELAGLNKTETLTRPVANLPRRRVLDPLTALGSRLVHERLQACRFDDCQAELLPYQDRPQGDESGLIGCLIRLPGWHLLSTRSFRALLVEVHRHIEDSAQGLLQAFTGHSDIPAPWSRWPLLAKTRIHDNLDDLGYSQMATEPLKQLADTLHSLSPNTIERLSRHPRQRIQHLSLIPPSYALNLHSPQRNGPRQALIDASPVYLIIQPKLFSAVGGAGALPLAGIPSVYVRRGSGRFSDTAWRLRAEFQREFLSFNRATLQQYADPDLAPVRRLGDFQQGWI
jgi:hypothetical protein